MIIMNGIIIAAGMGLRLRPNTDVTPKCMLPIVGKSMLDWSIDSMKLAGCKQIIVITGHAQEKITRKDIIKVENKNYKSNNILHSLMCASDFLNDDCLVSYSDIWVEPYIYKQLASSVADIKFAVDTDWHGYYLGRTCHPISEAELVEFNDQDLAYKFGKGLNKPINVQSHIGEFLGLWKMSLLGSIQFVKAFSDVNTSTKLTEPFQLAREWQKAYITDFAQYMADLGIPIDVLRVKKGWIEIDTNQDYEKIFDSISSRSLDTLYKLIKAKK
jgi:choline kinase